MMVNKSRWCVRANNVSGLNLRAGLMLMPFYLNCRRKQYLWSLNLSHLRRASFPGSGGPELFPKLSWDDFVQLVLELTIKAYEAMYQARIARSDWEENVFSLRLGEDYLRSIAFDH